MKLLVDIGNQRLKWLLVDAETARDVRAGALPHGGEFDLEALAEQFDDIARPREAWVSSVASADFREQVATGVRVRWGIEPHFIVSQASQCGVSNSYPQPASLGCDRWAALVAAADRYPRRNVVVVDAGTAVTVDLLDRFGHFHGGVIFPGIQTMRTSLSASTGNIRVDDQSPDHQERVAAVTVDTRSAVSNGTLMAVTGGIVHAVRCQQDLLGESCLLLLTGGDAGRLLGPLREARSGDDVEQATDLVLRGLDVISREANR